MTLLELRASVRPTLLLAIGLFETRLSSEIRWFENTSSTVIHWITKKNGKAIRVKIWSNSGSNSVIALVFGLPYKGTKKF